MDARCTQQTRNIDTLLLLAQGLRRWPSIKTTLDQCWLGRSSISLLFLGYTIVTVVHVNHTAPEELFKFNKNSLPRTQEGLVIKYTADWTTGPSSPMLALWWYSAGATSPGPQHRSIPVCPKFRWCLHNLGAGESCRGYTATCGFDPRSGKT